MVSSLNTCMSAQCKRFCDYSVQIKTEEPTYMSVTNSPETKRVSVCLYYMIIKLLVHLILSHGSVVLFLAMTFLLLVFPFRHGVSYEVTLVSVSGKPRISREVCAYKGRQGGSGKGGGGGGGQVEMGDI